MAIDSRFNPVFERLTPMLVGALGTNVRLREIIDETYSKRPQAYYNAYREGVSKLFEKEIPKYYSFKHTTYIEKIGGIVEYAFATNNFLDVYRIIKRGYAPLYNWVLNSTRVDFITATEKIEKIYAGEFMPEVVLYNGYVITMYLVVVEEATKKRRIKADYENWTYVIDKTEGFIEGNLKLYHNKQKEINIPRKDLELQGLLDEYRDLKTIESFIENIIEDKHREDYFPNEPKGVNIYKKYPEPILSETRNHLFQKGGVVAYIGALTTFLKYYGVFENSFALELSNTDLKNLQDMIDFSKEYNGLAIDDDFFTVTLMYLLMLTKEIQIARPLAVRSSKEYQEFEEGLKVQQEIADLNLKIQQLEMEKAQLQLEVNSKTATISQIREEAVKVEQHNRKLQASVDEMSKDKYEINRLRQLVFMQAESESEETQPLKEDLLEKMTLELNEYNITVIGGHESWVDRLKVTFPNWTYLTVESANNRKLKSLNFDYLLFNINKNSHGSYYRIQQNVPKEKILYANHNNVSRTIESVYQQIND